MTAFSYLIRREAWENRAFVYAPVAVAALLLLGVFLSLMHDVTSGGFEHVMLKMEELGEMRTAGAFAITAILMSIIACVFSLVMMIMLFFYLLDALYAERKDRSILFWRSLPVSDTQTVLSKLASAVILVPLITLAAIAVTDILVLAVGTVFTWIRGGSAWELIWGPAPLFKGWVITGYFLLTLGIWFLPFFSWLLLVSSWARQTVFLWAVLPPLGITVLEYMINGTHRIFSMLGEWKLEYFRSAWDTSLFVNIDKHGATDAEELAAAETIRENLLSVIDLGGFLAAPELWVGFIVSALFLTGAIYLRRYRDES